MGRQLIYIFRNKELTDEVAVYKDDFTVESFLERFPNPFEVFYNPERKSVLSEADVNKEDAAYALHFLSNHFIYLREREIAKIFKFYNKHLIKTFNMLSTLPRAFKTPRSITVPEVDSSNLELLKEVPTLS